MVNVLIADDNIEYAINLMNYINDKNTNIKVCNITKDGKETIEILNSKNYIDVVLLDYKMPFYNGDQVLMQINNKEKYLHSCIIISGEIQSIANLTDNELIYSVIYKTVSMDKVIEKINELSKYKETLKISSILKNKITRELLYLGYDISHKGTQYLIKTIEYVIDNKNGEVDNLERYIYPYIAMIHNETVHNIKCRINRATDSMYYNCNIEELKKYFCFSIDIKPKIKTVISTIINKIS